MTDAPAGVQRIDFCLHSDSSSNDGIGCRDRWVPLIYRVRPFSAVKFVVKKFTTMNGASKSEMVTSASGSFRGSQVSAWSFWIFAPGNE